MSLKVQKGHNLTTQGIMKGNTKNGKKKEDNTRQQISNPKTRASLILKSEPIAVNNRCINNLGKHLQKTQFNLSKQASHCHQTPCHSSATKNSTSSKEEQPFKLSDGNEYIKINISHNFVTAQKLVHGSFHWDINIWTNNCIFLLQRSFY